MARFQVAPELFGQFPELCFGVVVAEGVQNRGEDSGISQLLQKRAEALAAALEGMDARSHPHVAVWRDAFQKLGQNPNKFPSSIEALSRRIAKRPELPRINKVVDLVNAVSVMYVLPMGAHDLAILPGDIEVRLGRPGDQFIPFGSTEPEGVDPGEVVYATGNQIRTRKWVWRQSELAKVTEGSSRIFFPIDGFYGVTDQAVQEARSELAELLERHTGATVRMLWVDRESPGVEIG